MRDFTKDETQDRAQAEADWTQRFDGGSIWKTLAREARLRVGSWLARALPPPTAQPTRYDDICFGIAAEGTFARDAWDDGALHGTLAMEGEENRVVHLAAGPALGDRLKKELDAGWALVAVAPPFQGRSPTVSGKERVYQTFKPQKLVLDETLVATFASARDSAEVAATPDEASDLVLVSLYVGNVNCFPYAPDFRNGLSGRALGVRSVVCAVSLPTVYGGLDVQYSAAVTKTALYRLVPPEGFTTGDLVSLRVEARLNLFGPGLR